MAERDWQKDWDMCQNATPRPWLKSNGFEGRYIVTGGPHRHYVCTVQIKQTGPAYLHEWMEEERKNNLELIVQTPDMLSYWLQRVKELEAQVEWCRWAEECPKSYKNAKRAEKLEYILEPLHYQDRKTLLKKIHELRQADGESWAIGEVIERALETLEKEE